MSEEKPEARKRKTRLRDERITLVHGAGGKATHNLIEALFLEELRNPLLEPLGDSALIEAGGARLAFTTDAHVVQPLFFPGGDIGSLAVNGTVNDIAVSGARPIAQSAALVLVEGLPVADLRRIVASMAEAAREAGVVVAAGDTKVVERGRGDGLTVTTAAIGLVDERVALGAEKVRPGDKVLVSGTLGDHGMAVMIARGNLELEVEIESDSASVFPLAESLFSLGDDLRWLRDPTRGGLATTLNELTEASGLCVVLEEKSLPVHEQVAAACEI
ncbi:MAG: hydrogenase expression/formation protein HypE, partial [Gaiellaceae bacterium]